MNYFPYGKYQSSRDAAWQCLLDNNVRSLPVSVTQIARQNHIRIGAYSENAGLIHRLGLEPHMIQDGFSTRVVGRFIILFRDDLPPGRTRFTIAHELGHIFLGHLLPTVENDGTLEHQANVFASRLLAPACVLWGLGVHSAEEISALCDISLTAAGIRAERMATLYAREASRLAAGQPSCFLLSHMERKVYENFKQYIRETK